MATWNAATCSQTDVEAAIALASNGDTVVVPAGSATWGAAGHRTFITTAITVMTSGTVTITFANDGPTSTSGVITILAAATFKGFTINGNASGTGVVPFTVSSGVAGWRITGITYNQTNPCYYVYSDGAYGIIDNCTINSGGNSELIYVLGPANSWTTPSTMGTLSATYIETNVFNNDGYVCDANANSRVVVRFNTINGDMKIDAHGFASNTPRGVRHIEAYNNTFNYATPGFSASFDIRGGTGMIFDNVSTGRPYNQFWFFLDDYGVVNGPWPNFGVAISSVSVGNPTTVTTTTPHGYSTGWPVWVEFTPSNPILTGIYTVTVTGLNTFTIPVSVVSATGGSTSNKYTTAPQTPVNYPITDQIGVGMDPKVAGSEPMYLWNNSAEGVDWQLTEKDVGTAQINLYRVQTGNLTATFTEYGNIIKADRDFFKHVVGGTFNGTSGVGRGTKAQMNAITPTLAKVGFWVTDEGTWNNGSSNSGQLYTWNGSTWNLAYTPLTYPHPLATSGGSSPTIVRFKVLLHSV